MKKVMGQIFAAVAAVSGMFSSAVRAASDNGSTTAGEVLGTANNNNNGLLWIIGLLVLAAIIGLILFILANRNRKENN